MWAEKVVMRNAGSDHHCRILSLKDNGFEMNPDDPEVKCKANFFRNIEKKAIQRQENRLSGWRAGKACANKRISKIPFVWIGNLGKSKK